MADIRTWNKDLVLELLALYKSFPCLWKIKSEQYKNKNLKKEAYDKIVIFCKEKGFPDANRDFVVKKLQSLRGSFRKELRKVEDSHRNGTEEVYQSSLWYYDYLLFTKDQELPTDSIYNADEDPDENIDIDHNIIECEITENSVGEIDHQTQMIDAAWTESASTPRRNKRKASDNYQAESFKVRADTLKSNHEELSEFELAGMNVAKKLAKMDPVQAIYAESIINNVLCKGLLKKLTEDTDLCDNYCNKNVRTPTSVD
ncbi:uncharacterized protein LOC125231411 [Leguminivora glycinivorella]|uniref:uncharacterized protein LOC125231411 n=1 Tax=Leguminivora glycinivorella TaxID=1035111 RepID=UPI00200D669B|nr:uncharacterized protein LOC125231411 [Leguminivora glycinivorella]